VDGTWGLFGAVAGAVSLQGGDGEAAHSALNAAACQVPYSLYLPVAAGATVRNTYAGQAAAQAVRVVAAMGAGISAPDNAVAEFAVRALGPDAGGLTLAPPGEWLVTQGYLKPFAAARHVHYGAQAALNWRERIGADAHSITALHLGSYDEALTYCGNRAPTAALQAQFSLTYGVAHALVHGHLDPGAYTPEALADPEVVRLEGLIELDVDPEISAGGRGARLTVTTPNGSETFSVGQVAGDPAQPLSMDQVRAKFERYAAPTLGEANASRIADAILAGELNSQLSGILNP
jgi:2-methylcitrate dehydratase PrpD